MVTKVVNCSKTSTHMYTVGESGNKETPNHMHNLITNSGPGIAKPKLPQGIAIFYSGYFGYRGAFHTYIDLFLRCNSLNIADKDAS